MKILKANIPGIWGLREKILSFFLENIDFGKETKVQVRNRGSGEKSNFCWENQGSGEKFDLWWESQVFQEKMKIEKANIPVIKDSESKYRISSKKI